MRGYLDGRLEAMVDLLTELVLMETPTDVPSTHAPARKLLVEAWADLGYRHRHIPGRETSGHVLFIPSARTRHRPIQLMVGHLDTVWPVGTLEHMPVRREGGLLRGPGVFDMKGGLVMMIFAVEALQALDVPVSVTPVAFVNSDEEIGSPESRGTVRRLARAAGRALILEPALGPVGKVKTARKGVGHFTVSIQGRAAHAGLEPEAGTSAILELAHVIQMLHGLNDLDRGLSVNVGVIEGGTRPNVVAARSEARVDVRALSLEDADEVTRAIQALEPVVPGVTLEVTGGFEAPPLERTPRNTRLWEQTRRIGAELGLDLEDVTAGGGSDGNTTSQYTATLDGLGPRGDGAHAVREHIVVESLVERTALLAALLAAPLAEEAGA
ncbi:MAG: M20 family metallopeptidase [Gemmatimonadota bacterium]